MKMINRFHSRKTIRLKGYDYSQPGFYYVTICTQNRECVFGDVVNGKMVLNDIGNMIEKWWNKIPNKFNAVLDEKQIMPNHLHGVIHIVGVDPRVDPTNYGRTHGSDYGRTHGSAHTNGTTIGTIIQWFKTMSTNEYIKNVRDKKWKPFNKRLWQRNYYEHIIRTENDLNKIREYIKMNPKIWDRDRNNPKYKHE